MKPGERAAIKLSRVHGHGLLCVRYRENPDGTERLTTIKLVVERVAIQSRPDPVVSFKINPEETELRRIAQVKGAKYGGKHSRWKLKRNEVLQMGLKNLIAVADDKIDQEQVHP